MPSLSKIRSLAILPLAVLAGFALSFAAFQVMQRLQPPPVEETEDATPTPTPTVTPTPPPPGPFGLPFRPPAVTLPFSVPVASSPPLTVPVGARLPFVSGPEPTPTAGASPSPAASPPALARRGTPTPRPPTATPSPTPRATVALSASRPARQYAERVARSLEQLATAQQRYATLRYTWRPGRDAASTARTALDLHDLARTAQAQAQALEQPPPPPGLEELSRTAAAAWEGLAQSAEQFACVVLSDGRDRGCLQRANEAQSQTREASSQAALVLARVAEVVRMPTPTPTPNLSSYWVAVAPRLEAMRNAADVIAVTLNAHARGEVDNQEVCRLLGYVPTFADGQTLAPLPPPAGWQDFHAAFVAWASLYGEGLTSLGRFCAALPAASGTPTPPARGTPTPPASPDLDRARRSFIAGDAERDRFEAILANPPAQAAG